MKLKFLSAENVHGYLAINIKFNREFTFLIGVNGAGKTSALRLIAALLSPNLEELARIEFTQVLLIFEYGARDYAVRGSKNKNGLQLSLDDENMYISSTDLQLILNSTRTQEHFAPIREKFAVEAVYRKLAELPTPTFLGIERRSSWAGTSERIRTISGTHFRYMGVDESRKDGSPSQIADVNVLVSARLQQVRAEQVQLDDRLRTEFFKRAFEYKKQDLKFDMPTRAQVQGAKNHLTTLLLSAHELTGPMEEIAQQVRIFIDSMSQVVDTLEKDSKQLHPSSRPMIGSRRNKYEDPPAAKAATLQDKTVLEWVVNSPQAERIQFNLDLLTGYIRDRSRVNEPITRFLALINGFFKETKKQVRITEDGSLSLELISGGGHVPKIPALASGERQLLVMLAHLALSREIEQSGVFMIDEPELSLHIAWQENFADALFKANPNVQFIMATHSPAIIMDREKSCVEAAGY